MRFTEYKECEESPPGARPRLHPAAFVFLLGALAFLPALRFPPLLDDPPLTLFDARLDPPLRPREILFTPLWPEMFPPEPLWRPALHGSFAIERALYGAWIPGWRLNNFLLHGAVAAAFWLLALRLGAGRRAAALAAALFALHPVHTEAVVSLAGRAELLMALGVFLALLAGLRAAADASRRFLPAALGATAARALAVFSKEQGFLAPGLWALAWLIAPIRSAAAEGGGGTSAMARRALLPRAALQAALFAALALAAISLRLRLFGTQLGFRPENLPALDNPLVAATAPERIATALRVWGRALGLMIAPWPLSPDYSSPGVAAGLEPLGATALCGAALLALVALAAALAWRGFRGGAVVAVEAEGAPGSPCAAQAARLGAFAIAWFFLTFLPTSNLLTLNGTIFGERLLYLPSAGACLALGIGLDLVLSRFRAAPADARLRRVAAAAAIAALLAGCWLSLRPWRSQRALFEQVLRVVPRSAKGHYGLSMALAEEGDLEGARRQLHLALALWPSYELAWHQMGVLLLAGGDRPAAREALRRALRLDPRLAESWNSLGNLEALEGDYAAALRCFETYQRLGAKDPEALRRKIAHTRNLLRSGAEGGGARATPPQ